jgi:hypothetical protein
VEWLQPDWMLEPATMSFQWRSLRRRPALDVEIARVDHSAWKLFAPFHYLSADLHRAAACYVPVRRGHPVPASFAGPGACCIGRIARLADGEEKVDDIKGVSRLVRPTLPDYQGVWACSRFSRVRLDPGFFDDQRDSA